MNECNVIVILGPTASGKTRLAAHTAAFLDSEIISADSRQVYRGMNIGTGKDLEEYAIGEKQISYHLIDIVEAGSDYNLNNYISDFKIAFERVSLKNKIPILCGGTALYIDAVLRGYEFTGIPLNQRLRDELKLKTIEELQRTFLELSQTSYHKVADTSTHKRTIRAIEIAMWLNENENQSSTSFPKLQPIIFGLAAVRESRREQIKQRLNHRLNNGLIEEVQTLLNKGIQPEKLIFYGLEYKFVMQYLQNKIDYNYFVEHLTIAIQQYAKRQMTYFRKIERDGFKINWVDADLSLEDQLDYVKEKLIQEKK